MPRWRKATWALVVWTILMALWIGGGIAATGSGPGDCGTLSQDACEAAYGLGAGIGVTALFFLWFIGFLILGLVWLMSRPKENVVVYGPEGQQVTVTEKEAKRRVGKGWTYQPPLPPAASS
jgi:hypothetical protein